MNIFHVVIELAVPLAILTYTHFLDETVHTQLEHNNVYHGRAKWIFRYQWEICLLVISLTLIFGVKLIEEVLFRNWGIFIVCESILAIIALSMSTINILSARGIKNPTAKPFYLAVFIYLQFAALMIAFYLINSEWSFIIVGFEISGTLFLMILSVLLALTICFFTWTYLERILFQPVVLKGTPLKILKTISKHKRAGDAMKIEALKKMLRDASPGSHYWQYAKEKLTKDYPKHLPPSI